MSFPEDFTGVWEFQSHRVRKGDLNVDNGSYKAAQGLEYGKKFQSHRVRKGDLNWAKAQKLLAAPAVESFNLIE